MIHRLLYGHRFRKAHVLDGRRWRKFCLACYFAGLSR